MEPYVQAIDRQPGRAPDGALVYHERRRPEQTTLDYPAQQHAEIIFAQAEAGACTDQSM